MVHGQESSPEVCRWVAKSIHIVAVVRVKVEGRGHSLLDGCVGSGRCELAAGLQVIKMR